MKIYRNGEIAKGSIVFAAVSFVFSAMAFIMDTVYGIITVCLCICLYAVFMITSAYKYRKIGQFSEELDKVLHGSDDVMTHSMSEGELAILEDEIVKMTTRLYEQKNALLLEKSSLADSIADISHQVRTPLTSMNIVVSMLSAPEIDNKTRRKLTQELYMLLSRIDQLISALLKMSKLDAQAINMKNETVSLSALIEKSVSPLLISAELRGVAINYSGQGSFFGDIQWMSEAIGNIVKNCMEHNESGGCVNITASENAVYSEIIITDDGCGIDKDDLPHIFERFYKGKNSGANNVGIGLALARAIIIRQNGSVKAENNTDKGAKFTVRIYKSIV